MGSFKYDTHVHTSETSPCSMVSASEIVRLYKQAGYTGIVITDHYSGKYYFDTLDHCSWTQIVDAFLKGYRTARDEGDKIGLTVLLGIEICFEEGINDYLVYGVDEDFLYENPRLYAIGLKAFRNLTYDRGFKIYQAHPFRIGFTTAPPSLIDGVEVYNGNPRHDSNNMRAYDFARASGLKMLSGSDFHRCEDLARGGMVLAEAPRDSAHFTRLLSAEPAPILLSTVP